MAITDNLVAYWKLDESSGNAADASGNGYTLTNTGTAAFAAGKINNATDLGASNTSKYFVISNNGGIDGGAMSFQAWVNNTTAPGTDTRQGIVLQQNNTSDVAYIMFYADVGGTKKIRFNRLRNGVADGMTDYSTTLTGGTWYHIVCTYDATDSRIYLNGSLVSGPTAQSGSGSGTNTDRMAIGIGWQGGGAAPTDVLFSGLIDEVGIWSRALSATEVTQLYNGGSGLAYPFVIATGSPPGVAAFGSFAFI